MLGNRPGLDATTAAIQDLVTVRLGEEAQLLGKYDLQSLGLTYSTIKPVLASRPSPSPSGLARSNTSLAAARAPLRSLSLRFIAYSRTPRAGSTIALRRACAAALTWGAAPPWNRHTLPPGIGGLPHRSPARLAAVHWLMGFWSAM